MLRLKKLLGIILTMTLILSAVPIPAFAAKEEVEVVEESEGMLIEGYVQKIYDNFADFKKEVANGELVKHLQTGDFRVKLSNKVYLLQTGKSVSTLKFRYAGKTTRETLKLQQIICGPDNVTFNYGDDIYFTYYPDYRLQDSVTATKQIYSMAKEDAIRSKVINKHRVYVTEHETYQSELEYGYTWVEDGCLFEIFIPKEKGIHYGFALLKLKRAHTFR